MAKISKSDAIELAKTYKEAAVLLGQFQLDHWDELSATDRRDLTDEEYTLIDFSQNLVTYAMGVLLDEAQASIDDLKNATDQANKALQKIETVKKALTVATALVKLGGAIHAGDPGAIASSIGGVYNAVKS